MKVWDAQNAICDQLQAMPWRRYMCALWLLGTELAALYAEQQSGPERSLMSDTLDVLRLVVTSGDPGMHEAQAAELTARWERVITDGEQRASAGLVNAWMTFEAAAAEITGVSARFYAADWVTDAAVERWRDPDRRGRRRLDPNEEVSDDSPIAQTLAAFAQIVSTVARLSDVEDPALLRRQIFRSGPRRP
jgi:hypothetical protein